MWARKEVENETPVSIKNSNIPFKMISVAMNTI